MSQKVKEEPLGFTRTSPTSASIPVSHLNASSSPIVLKRPGGTPVSALRIDSSGRATPVSIIKANTAGIVDSKGKTPSYVKIVRATPTGSQEINAKIIESPSVKTEPREGSESKPIVIEHVPVTGSAPSATTAKMEIKRKFDPTALAVPIKTVPRTGGVAMASSALRIARPIMVKKEPPSAALQSSSSTSDSSDVVHEFIVRAPKVGRRRFSVLRFTGGVDFTKCEKAIMQRENNLREFKTAHDIVDIPKSGAGSEYRREQREEARRKKYGLKAREYNPHDQPWILQFHPTAVKTEVKQEVKSEVKSEPKSESKKDNSNSSSGKTEVKRFRGNREGSITDNVTYFVFTQCKDGAFEAFPISAWYKMTAAPPYKHLNTDEAEMEYARRGKIRNYMNLMVQRRLQDAYDEGDDGDGRGNMTEEKGTGGGSEAKGPAPVVAREALSDVTKAAVTKVDAEASAARARRLAAKNKQGKKNSKNKRRSNFLLTEMDDWVDSDLDDDMDDDDGGPDAGDDDGDSDSGARKDGAKAKSVRRGAGRKQAQAQDSDSEVVDDSEPDDREGEEVDYMTHSSSDEEKLAADEREAIYEEKGVAEEDALKGLLTDASSEDEDEEEKKDEDGGEAGSKRKEAAGATSGAADRHSSRPGPGPGRAGGAQAGGSDDSSSSSSSSEDESDSDLEKEAAKVPPILSRLTSMSAAAGDQPSSSSSAPAAPWPPADDAHADASRKRKDAPDDGAEPGREVADGSSAAKRFKLAAGAGAGPSGGGGGGESVVTEEAIRRYLLRKPMTAKDLLLKFSRRLRLRKCEISKQIARLLQRMRVQKKNVNGMTLLSLSN